MSTRKNRTRGGWVERVKGMMPGKRILAVETAGDDVRAAVVRGWGKAMEIMDYATLKCPDAKDPLPDATTLHALAERLGVSGGAAVLVSPLARAFELFMDRDKIQGLKPHQLREAVKWEVEPYTGIDGSAALIAVERKPEIAAKPGEIVFEEDDHSVINVAAIERNVYRAARERFKMAGFRLVRVYPPEACFYYVLNRENLETPRAVLEVGQDYSNFAILNGGVPEQINTLSLSRETLSAHISGELISQDLVDTLRFTIRQAPEPEPLVLSGVGVADGDIANFIADLCPNGAVVLDLPRTAGLTDAKGDPSHAAYGTVVGAAMRELRGRSERQTGIDDSEPLMVRVRRSAYLMPVAVTAFLVLFLSGHYAFMRFKEEDFKARIAEYERTLKENKEAVAAYEGVLAEREGVLTKRDQAKKRLDYMENQADKKFDWILTGLGDIGRVIPAQVSLASITQEGEKGFFLEGNALNLEAPGLYATRLQEQSWCESAVLEYLASGTGGGGGGKTAPAPRAVTRSGSGEQFQFQMRVNVKGG
jgi:hypothetical protein